MNLSIKYDRFSKLFALDFSKIISSYGLTLMLLAFIPVISSAIAAIYSFIMSTEMFPIGIIGRIVVAFMTLGVFVLTLPSFAYGYITDKKEGSAYILLPASVSEKFLSMLLNVCVIFPLAFISAYLFLDWVLVQLSFVRGDSLLSLAAKFFIYSNDKITINFGVLAILGFITNILTYLCGAVWFRKRKIVMTILTYMALQMIFSMFTIPFLSNSSINDYFIGVTAESIISFANISIILTSVLSLIVLLSLIFIRLRTIKH